MAPRSFGWYWTWVAGQEPKDQRFGHLTAVDANSGTVLWNNNSDTPTEESGMQNPTHPDGERPGAGRNLRAAGSLQAVTADRSHSGLTIANDYL